MTLRLFAALALIAPVIVAPAAAQEAAGPLVVTSEVKAESRVTAADGTTRIALVAPNRLVPGDRVQVVIAYRNAGRQPLADLVLANPVPRGLAFRGVAAGSPAPELSVDGHAFASLASLQLRGPDGHARAASADDVTHVRWRLTAPLAPGARGTLAFAAMIR